MNFIIKLLSTAIVRSVSKPPTLNNDDFFKERFEIFIPGLLNKKSFKLILFFGFL